MKKFLNVLGNILITLIVIFSVVVTVSVILSARNESGLPSLFGYSVFSVQTDSMESENGFYVGDVIIIKNLTAEESNNLKVGDVITFISSIGDTPIVETHRIVEDVYQTNKNEVIDGIYVHGGMKYYVTMGDKDQVADQWMDGRGIAYSSSGNIVGIWTGKRIPKLGAVIDFLRSSTGFMICIVIPIALFFLYELYVFIMTLTRRQKERALAEVADKEAELKAKAVAEFLAQQQANGGETAPPAENTAPAAPAGDASPVPPSPQTDGSDAPAAPADKPAEAPADEPKDEPKPAELSEAEKQRIIQEYLAKQKQSSDEE